MAAFILALRILASALGFWQFITLRKKGGWTDSGVKWLKKRAAESKEWRGDKSDEVGEGGTDHGKD